jgi:hypothetical protein
MQSACRRRGYPPAAAEDIWEDLYEDDELDAAEADEVARCNLHVCEDDKGAGESVDPNPVVPTVGAN